MQVLSLSHQDFQRAVQKATAALLKGKVLVVPTDTVYGLLADATNKKAVSKVFLIKGREQGKPLPIFVKNIAMAKKLARVSPSQEKYMKKVWPGKATLVLESRGVLPKETGTKEYIGLRIPKYKLVQHILQKVKKPLTGTSANLTGKLPFTDSRKVALQFKNRKRAPDILLDAGNLPHSRPSKVLDITKEKPKVLRK